MKHASIPIFIPMQGCPYDCVFCNQPKITGQAAIMPDNEIIQKIENHLETLAGRRDQIEIAFFGGSFTGLPLDMQQHYLGLVQPYLTKKQVKGIRLSTRPDYINEEVLDVLKDHGVTTIELGVQSMDDEVLLLSGRGHTADDVRRAATMVKAAGFSLVLQMMPGLPGDTLEKTTHTANRIIALGADATRIYPTLVIKDTHLEKLFIQNKYTPLTLDEAVHWCSQIVPFFEMAGVKILRLGLHASEGLLFGKELVAGPFHAAFGEMVYSQIWHDIFSKLSPEPARSVELFVHPRQLNHAIGHKRQNRKMLEEKFRKVIFKTDVLLEGRNFRCSL